METLWKAENYAKSVVLLISVHAKLLFLDFFYFREVFGWPSVEPDGRL
jgi:hypothetical protein